MLIINQILANNKLCEIQKLDLTAKINKIYAALFFKEAYGKFYDLFNDVENQGHGLIANYRSAKQTVADNCAVMKQMITAYSNQAVGMQTPRYEQALRMNTEIRGSFLKKVEEYHNSIDALESYRRSTLHKNLLLYDYLKRMPIPAKIHLTYLNLSC